MGWQATIERDSDPRGLFAALTMPPAFYKRVNETRFKQEWRLSMFQYWCLKRGWSGFGDPWTFFRMYLALMKPFKGPKRQRGTFHMFPAGSTALLNAGQVVMSGTKLIVDQRFTAGTADARISFENDGELKGVKLNGTDLDYTGEWWSLEPESGIGSSYAARYLSGGSGVWDTSAAAVNNWITISTTRQWGVTRTATGSESANATFEVGPTPSGPADDSAGVTCTAIIDNL